MIEGDLIEGDLIEGDVKENNMLWRMLLDTVLFLALTVAVVVAAVTL